MTSLYIQEHKKRIAVVSLNHKRQDLVEWAYDNKDVLLNQELFATGTTAEILEGTLNSSVTPLSSLLTAGIAELSEMINEKKIDILILFYDTMKANKRNKHIADLIELAINTNTAFAANTASANLILKAIRFEPKTLSLGEEGKKSLQ
jgi:methylglyoxal synthase